MITSARPYPRLAPIADRVAAKMTGGRYDWQDARDRADIATGSELPPSRLDRLADMVASRLRSRGVTVDTF